MIGYRNYGTAWKNLWIRDGNMHIFFSIIILIILLCVSHKNKKKLLEELNNIKESNNKNWINYNVAIKLLYTIENSNRIAQQINKNGFSTVAIYGMGPIGTFFTDELSKNGIKVFYAIDQNAELIYADVPVYNPKDALPPQVDAVIVTSVYYYEQIKKVLEDKLKCPIVSLYDYLM